MSEHSRAGRVLLIEDDPDQVFLITAFLESSGYEVISALSTGEGLSLDQVLQFNCVIVDLMMPDGGAVEFLKHRKSQIPVIVITAAVEAQSSYALELGATAVCSKQNMRMRLPPLLQQCISGKIQE